MEPERQAEIQLGHMCNNRCVFCVSGQQTAFGRARPLALDPILSRVSEAYEAGNRKLTILGGEPTLQPAFKDVVRHAVNLGFREIVIFTNGVKTARAAFIDEVLAIGGNLTWRISIQGANKETHERTTLKAGSFDRILRSMQHLKDRGQRITVNMCVVQSNYESVHEFPELLARHGVTQLHLDMIRPNDAGERSEDDYRAMIPRYSSMVEPLRHMVEGFPDDFDVNIGNLPYCIAPELAHRIHHDGETTSTIAVDGDNELSRPWDKYFVKRRDKGKIPSCASCVFDRRCNGIFDRYRDMYGTDELVPVTAERLRKADPGFRLFGVHLEPTVQRLEKWEPPKPYAPAVGIHSGDVLVRVTLRVGGDGPLAAKRLVVELRPPGPGAGSFDLFSFHVLEVPPDRAVAQLGIDALWQELARSGHRVWHPAGGDALAGETSRGIASRLQKLREAAPFGDVEWHSLDVGEDKAVLGLVGPDGERATLWLADERGRSTGGYELDGDPTPPLVDGLRRMMAALKPPPSGPRRALAHDAE